LEAVLLEKVPAPLLALAIVGVTVAVAIGGLLVVRRIVPPATLESHQDVASYIFAVVAVLYAVLLAFVVIAVWEEFEDAEADATREASALWLLYEDAKLLGGPGDAATDAVVDYVRSVVDEEWPAMETRQAEAPATDLALETLWDRYSALTPQDDAANAFYEEGVERLHEVSELRRTRIFISRGGLPGSLWSVLIVGALLCIAFTYFFGVRNVAAQVLMVSALGAMIGLVLFLILSLELPFTGDLRVGPDALRRVLVEFGHV
jgi:hypothetical protein